jgi:MoaA/NifB/PqqE/SkfB family radical SAM enzyme
MTPSDYARVVKEAMALGATTFGLEGGEPFIFKGWESVIEACQPWKNHIIISTNGFLFDEKKARRCAELGVDTINFSLDSGIPELHDAFRRQAGSFKRVVEGIGLCKKYGINPLINTVVHKGNLYTDGFIQLLEFAEKEKVLINTLLAKGVGNFKDKDAVLSPEDLSNYQQIVRPYHYVRRHLAFNYAGKFGCPGTKEMINMTPYGDVMNCANMHIYFGNVMEEPLAVIRERAIRNSPFGLYHACFLADDVDFMKIYYPILEQQGSVDLDTFMNGLRDYEHHTGKKLYGGLSQRCSECQGI